MGVYYAYDGSVALVHHGIKGMRWGYRRYQNPDGTLTEEGKKRYYKPTLATARRLKNLKEAGVKLDNNGDLILPKGTKITRFTYDKETVDGRRKYGSVTDEDTEYWKSDFKYGSMMKNWENPVNKDTYHAKKDLKVAGRNAVVNEVLKEIGDVTFKELDNNLSKSEGIGLRSTLGLRASLLLLKQYGDVKLSTAWNSWGPAVRDPDGIDNREFFNIDKPRTFYPEEEFKRTAAVGNNAIRTAIAVAWKMGSEKGASAKTEKYFKDLGYDAIFDPNANFLDAPIIFLDPKSSMKKDKTEVV